MRLWSDIDNEASLTVVRRAEFNRLILFVVFWGVIKLMGKRCRDTVLGTIAQHVFGNVCRAASVLCIAGVGTFGVAAVGAEPSDALSTPNAAVGETVSESDGVDGVEPIVDVATQALIESLEKMHHFQADFAQFTQDSEGQVVQEIRGQVHLARPQRFHWAIKTPYRQTLVVQSQKLWILDEDLEQVTVQSLSTQVGLTPAILLSGDPAQIQAHYTVTMKALPNGAEQFVLRPRSEEGLFDQLNVVIQKGQLKEMDFRDTLGQRTAINFSEGRLNKPFDEAIFAVKVPEGYDFIEDL